MSAYCAAEVAMNNFSYKEDKLINDSDFDYFLAFCTHTTGEQMDLWSLLSTNQNEKLYVVISTPDF